MHAWKIISLTLVVLCGLLIAQSTQPATLELRAQQLFQDGKYALALPMLMQAEKTLPDNSDQLARIQEQIRFCQRNIPATTQPVSQAAPGTEPEQRKPHPKPKAGETLDFAIKDLGNFEYDPEKGGNIPEDVKQLSGCSVRINGYMIPLQQTEKISQFALVPSLFSCCFGQPPGVQHTIVVNCPKGKGVDYFPDELTVAGKLTVEEKKDDGFVVSVFEIEAASIKPAAK